MDKLQFIFSETLKTLCLIFLGLVAAKAVGGLQALGSQQVPSRWLAAIRGAVYAAILALVIVGARGVGVDTSAGLHALAAESDLGSTRLESAYANALRAVELRPGILFYWQDLSTSKFLKAQFASVLKDEPVLRALSGDKLGDETTVRFASCHYFLGQYDQVFPLTEQVIREDRFNAAPYVLEGMTYMAQKKYARAKQRFLEVLQFLPAQESAVEGLAHAYFLMGEPRGAVEVLNETQKFPFSPEARRRFDALKAFYAQ